MKGAQGKEVSFQLRQGFREEGGPGAGAGRMDGNVSGEKRGRTESLCPAGGSQRDGDCRRA